MDMIAQFNRLFAYDVWANREVLTSLRAIETPPPRSVVFMAHILAAQKLWWDVLRDNTDVRGLARPDFATMRNAGW